MGVEKVDYPDLNGSTLGLDKFKNIFQLIGVFLLAVSVFFLFKDKHAYFYSYLFAYMVYFTITMGGMFMVLIHHLTHAGWSTVIRRIPENLMANILLMGILIIPLLFGLTELYKWTSVEKVMSDQLLQVKVPYLNIPFLMIRLVIYFLIWNWISSKFFNSSVSQDQSGSAQLTLDMQRKSALGMVLYALTLTFFSIDLIMSLTPHWYSTIFGIYIFAGCVVAAFAVVSIILLILRTKNILKDIVTVEHYHDLGKLLYGFNIFWSYIAFCQYFLIWYANIPEETEFYLYHFKGSWGTVSWILLIGHFFIPFVLFMSKHFKRNLVYHFIMAVWLLFMHILDLYWIIMPNLSKKGFDFQILDLIFLFGIGCLYFSTFIGRLSTVNLIPIRDPRLTESLNHTNL